MQLIPPDIDALIRHTPEVLRQGRQFLVWKSNEHGKKIPIRPDGVKANYNNPATWLRFADAVELIRAGVAFGLGLALPIPALTGYDLVTGLVAVDLDAKNVPGISENHLPAELLAIARRLDSYTEVSPSGKGIRTLVFANLPIPGQHITRALPTPGMEIGIYRAGWVTITGRVIPGFPPTIESRQGELDALVTELWPDAAAATGAAPSPPPVSDADQFVIDWRRRASDADIEKLLVGIRRTPEQRKNIEDTWNLRRPWVKANDMPDRSFYLQRLTKELLFLQPLVGWSLQTVVDILVTFVELHGLGHDALHLARLRSQIAHARTRIAQRSRCGSAPVVVTHSPSIPPVTGKSGDGIVGLKKSALEKENSLPQNKIPASNGGRARLTKDHVDDRALVRRRRSAKRDLMLAALASKRGWHTAADLERVTGLSPRAVANQLYRLRREDLIETGDGKHRLVVKRPRVPCHQKPIPCFEDTGREFLQLSRSALVRRGWPPKLIDQLFPVEGRDYTTREVTTDSGHIVDARFYSTKRVKLAEADPSFEIRRDQILRPPRAKIENALRRVIKAANGAALTTSSLAFQTGSDVGAVRAAVNRMVKRGELERRDLGGRAAYGVPGGPNGGRRDAALVAA
jgi:hypothetical protein